MKVRSTKEIKQAILEALKAKSPLSLSELATRARLGTELAYKYLDRLESEGFLVLNKGELRTHPYQICLTPKAFAFLI